MSTRLKVLASLHRSVAGAERRARTDAFDGSGAPSLGGLGSGAPAIGLTSTARRLSFATGMLISLAALTALALFGVVRAPAPASAQSGFAEAPGQGFLPDNRAWELVSPPDKNGGGVMPVSLFSRAAADCTTDCAFVFTALQGFSDAVGSGVGFQYMARRTGAGGTQGWSTHAITPPQEAGSLAANLAATPLYVGNYSPDLSAGLFRTFSAIPATPATADHATDQASNLYVRRGLDIHGAATNAPSDLVTPCPACTDGVPPIFPNPPEGPISREVGYGNLPWPVDASEDLGHVIFHQSLNLTADASGFFTKLYKWDEEGGLSVVGVVPPGSDTECTGAECIPPANGGSTASGGGAPIAEYANPLSADGSRVFFTAPATGLGLPGSGANGQCQGTCSAYLRDDQGTGDPDDDTTIKLNASERTDCAGDPTCGGDGVPDPAPDPNGIQRALFQDATPDGDFAFFLTDERLTDDAPAPQSNIGDNLLYRYDATKPASEPDNLTFVAHATSTLNNPRRAVIGTSDDGATVYFSARPTTDDRQIKRWHEGDVSTVAHLGTTAASIDDNVNHSGRFLQTGNNQMARVSADGRFLTFASRSESPTGYENDGHFELYVYDAAANGGNGELACASCNPSGAPAFADVTVQPMKQVGGLLRDGVSFYEARNRALSDDGRFAFFTTAERLVPEDINGIEDAYVYNTSAGRAELLSSGTDSNPSYFLDASADGNDAFILTRERLSGWDIDQDYDLYDARVDGGFPEPAPKQAPCVGNDGCRGPGSQSPADSDTASSSEEGGNPAAQPECSGKDRKLAKAERKAKRLKRKARKASGMKAKRLRKKAKRTVKQTRKARQELKECRRSEGS